MSIAALLASALTSNSGVTSIASTRIYPLLLPESPTLPAITYQRISNSQQNGTSNWRESRWQISCWGKRREDGNGYIESQNLALAVKTALEEYIAGSGGQLIQMAYIVNELDDYDDDSKMYRSILDVILVTTGD